VIRAVIDVGSNSLILTVAEIQAGVSNPIFEATRVTGLGEGAKATGVLGEAPISRTLAALRELKDLARSHGADACLSVATMAVRMAVNRAEFCERASHQETPITVITGEEEARLGFLAVAEDPEFADCERISIVDPGGHSTELVTAERTVNGWMTRFQRSYAVGALGMRETTMIGESPDPLARLTAATQIDSLIGLEYLPGEAGMAVTLGATGTNLVSIRDRLTEWQPAKVHGARLDYEEISRAVGWLSGMTDSERAAVTGLQRGREKTIHIGALILERFLFSLRVHDCRVSIRGWRHAYLLEQAKLLTN